VCPATPAASLAKLLEASTTSGDIAKKTDKKVVSRHKRKTRMNKKGHEMRKKSKKDIKLNSKAKLGYIQ
jgi:hypothetical protein